MKISAKHLEPSAFDAIRQLPVELQNTGVALNLGIAPPDLQQQLVDTIHDKLKSSCSSREREPLEQVLIQVLAKVPATVSQKVSEQVDQDFDNLLKQVEPELRSDLESNRRLQKAIQGSTISHHALPEAKPPNSGARKRRTSVTTAGIVQAVAGLDEGKGVTIAQVMKQCSLTRPQATKLLEQCKEEHLLESNDYGQGIKAKFWIPKGDPPTEDAKPEPETAPQPSLDNDNNEGSRYQRELFPTKTDTPCVISNHYKVNIGKQCKPKVYQYPTHKIVNNINSQIQNPSPNTELASALRSHVGDDRADEILACGTPNPYEADDGTVYPNHDRCGHRLCALCVDSRKRQRFRKDGHLIVDGLEYMFITAVHENVDSITVDAVDSLRRASNAFLDSKAMSWATGGIRSLEFGYDASKGLPWRMHIHMLIPIVTPFTNIRAVKDAMHEAWRRHSVDDMHIAVDSAKYDIDRRLKYVGKGNDNSNIPADQLEALYLATENRQLINKFGSWLGTSTQIKPLTSGVNNPGQLTPTSGKQVIEQVERQLGTGDDEQPRF